MYQSKLDGGVDGHAHWQPTIQNIIIIIAAGVSIVIISMKLSQQGDRLDVSGCQFQSHFYFHSSPSPNLSANAREAASSNFTYNSECSSLSTWMRAEGMSLHVVFN